MASLSRCSFVLARHSCHCLHSVNRSFPILPPTPLTDVNHSTAIPPTPLTDTTHYPPHQVPPTHPTPESTMTRETPSVFKQPTQAVRAHMVSPNPNAALSPQSPKTPPVAADASISRGTASTDASSVRTHDRSEPKRGRSRRCLQRHRQRAR